MKKIFSALALSTLTFATLSAKPASITGTYVEARTAEVFAGACIMNGEAATTGREALLAWKVDRGQMNGVSLDGLAVVAAIAADANLGIHEIGGESTTARAALFLDARATPAQRKALVTMVRSLAGNVIGSVVHEIRVSTSALRLSVDKHLNHDASCGNKQWFGPLTTVDRAEMGNTSENEFSGAALCTKWSDPNKRSAFFGTFSY
jgi:hypothetical protein